MGVIVNLDYEPKYIGNDVLRHCDLVAGRKSLPICNL